MLFSLIIGPIYDTISFFNIECGFIIFSITLFASNPVNKKELYPFISLLISSKNFLNDKNF